MINRLKDLVRIFRHNPIADRIEVQEPIRFDSTVSFSNAALEAGDIALAQGSVLVGDSGGKAAALSAKGDTKVLIGNGTTIASYALSGDVTMTNGGAVTIGAAKVDYSNIALTAGTVLGGTTTTNVASEIDISASGAVVIGQGASTTPAAHALTGDVTMTNGGVTSIGANKVTNAMMSSDNLKVVKVTLSNADIKALRATPKTLIAAQGSNLKIWFHDAILFLDYGSEVLTESADNLAIRYVDGSGVIVSQTIEATGFIDQAADTYTSARAKIDIIATPAQSDNVALVLHNTGDGEYAGNASNDSTMTIWVRYRVLDVSA